MVKLFKTIITFVENNKLLVLISASAIVLTVPLFWLCFYASPAGDDFQHAQMMKNLLPPGYNIIQYLAVATRYSFSIFKEMQGAFTINMFIVLNPLAYSLYSMPLVYFLGFAFFIFGNYFLADTFSKKILDGDTKTSVLIASSLVLSSLQFIPLGESFYWYAGLVGYTVPYTMALLYFSNLIQLYYSKKLTLRTLGGVFLGLLLGGTNLPLCLFLVVTNAVIFIVTLIKRHRITVPVGLMNASLLGALAVNILAPGNAIRMSWGFEKMSASKAILMSFWGSTVSMGHILSYTTLIFFVVLLLIPMTELIKNTKNLYCFPWLFSAASFCAVSALFTPAFYTGLGEVIPTRYSNMTTMIIIWILFINIFYWVGWAVKNTKTDLDIRKYGLIVAILAVISLQAPLTGTNLENISSVKVAKEIVTGVSGGYKNEIIALNNLLTASGGKDVVYGVKSKPSTLYMIGIASDKNFWGNRAISKYFGLKSIRSEE